MKRLLPRKPSQRQKLVIKATEDFFNQKPSQNPSITKIALFLMGRRKGLKLLSEEEETTWRIRNNLQDRIYRDSLAGEGSL